MPRIVVSFDEESALVRWLEAHPRAWSGWPVTMAFDWNEHIDRLRRFRAACPHIHNSMEEQAAYQRITVAVSVVRNRHRRNYRKRVEDCGC